VGIFRRGSKDTGAGLDPAPTASDGVTGRDVGGATNAGAPAEPAEPALAATTPHPDASVSRGDGPFDRSEVQDLDGRLDLGALWLTGVPGMELRLEVEEESQNLVGVTAVLGESAVQLQAFAAPRSEGIWDEIRTEIAASITSAGGTADRTSGPLGTELQAQMPGQSPDGRTVLSPVRFVGVDGPRWFLRAVLSGPAASDQGAAAVLLDVVRSTVVVRGDEAMAPRELLPLKLPPQPDQGDGDDADRAQGDLTDGDPAPSINDFNPFERGPEITEIH